MITSNSHLTHPKYRPDIDGLRAIAILAVIAFHAFPNWFKSGFIGVDIFFVISGYLISIIIIGSLEHGSFSFVEFYIRRINRIFPALILVLIACFAFGWFVLLADEYKQLGKHIAGGAGFIANYLLWGESGYFDMAAESKPLLHLWSLGVEEQFYIVWPLLLWATWKRKFNLLTITLLLAFISFLLNLARINGGHFDSAFYSPQTRFWELLIGSVLGYITLHNIKLFASAKYQLDVWLGRIVYAQAPEADGKTLRNAQSLLGVGFLIAGFVLIKKEYHFPGWWAVLPTLGAALIISAGTQAWFNRVVLSSRILVWFGLISFPLYLWHWPLLTFVRIVVSDAPSYGLRIATVLASIALAWLTYKFVEVPIRLYKNAKGKAIFLLLVMIIVGYAGYNIFNRNGLETRYKPQSSLSDIERFLKVNPIDNCDSFKAIVDVSRICFRTKNPRVMLIGDSHAQRLFFGFALSNNLKFNRVSLMGAGACPPTLGFLRYEGCSQALNEAINYIKETPSIEYIVLTACKCFMDGTITDSVNKYSEGFQNSFNELKKLNRRIIFLIDNPTFQETKSPKFCKPLPLKLRSMLFEYPEFCNAPTEQDLWPNLEYDELVSRLRLHNPDIYFYDPTKIFCTNGKCKIFNNSDLLYDDWNHLSTGIGGPYLVNDLINSLELLNY